jgi:hypothetical protein
MKKWEAPKLIVLVRSGAEESVLSACKHLAHFESVGPGYFECWSGNPAFCFVNGTS